MRRFARILFIPHCRQKSSLRLHCPQSGYYMWKKVKSLLFCCLGCCTPVGFFYPLNSIIIGNCTLISHTTLLDSSFSFTKSRLYRLDIWCLSVAYMSPYLMYFYENSNVKGLRSPTKCMSVLLHLKSYIALLQETHLPS